MAKKSKPAFYAVAKGHKVGIFSTWAECEAQVKGVSGARFKSFNIRKDAETFLEAHHRDYKDPQLHSVKVTVSNPTDEELTADYADEGLLLTGYWNDHKDLLPDMEEDADVKPKKRQKTVKEPDGHQSEEFVSFDSSEGGLVHSSSPRKYSEPSDDVEAGFDNASKLNIEVIEEEDRGKKQHARAADNPNLAHNGKSTQAIRTIEVYTDGAAPGNGKATSKAGYGVYWPESQDPASDLYKLNESGRVPGKLQTNNRGELMGIIRAVQLCPDPDAQLIIYSDSKYCISAINDWQTNWRKNKWLNSKKEKVVNKDLIRLLERELRKRSLRPKLIHVKGHSSNVGNQEADRLAVEGAGESEVPLEQWQNMEPSDSEEEDKAASSGKAVAAWLKMGFTLEQARSKAGIKSL